MVAIKLEKKIQSNSLKNEAKIYQYLDGIDGIPKLKWYESNDEFSCLVIDLLGISVGKLILEYGPKPVDYVYNIGIQMIERIHSLHKMYLLHRDIKPNNFLFGIDDPDKIYLIDFGLCKRYKYNETHIPIKNISSIIGSYNFVSLNVINKIEPSRRDDLESCVYVMIYMLLGHLEWVQYKNNLLDINNSILVILIPVKMLLSYVRQLEFETEPNYQYMINVLKKYLKNK